MTPRILLLLALLPALIPGGCGFRAPAAVTPPAPLPEQFSRPAGVDEPVPEPWWQAFGDPVLDDLIDAALRRNFELEQAVARLRQAEALLTGTDAARLPTLTGVGEMRRGQQPGAAGERTGESSSLSLAAAFELDLWGKLTARSRGANLDRAATRAELKALLLGLSARVADSYFLVVEQRAQLQLAEQSIASYAESLAMVERRYREGLVPALDLYQARQNLAGARASREATASALSSAEHALAVLCGRYPGGEIAGALATIPAPPAAFPAGLPSSLLTRRPDLEAALLRVQAHDSRRAAAIAERFPSINLLGSYGTSRTTFSVPTLEGEFWNLVGDLALPLFDGGRRRAEVSRQEGLVAESLARYRQAVLIAFQEVEDALARSAADEQRIAHLTAAEEASDAAQRLALERYRYGLGEYLPVLTAQIFHFQIQGNLLAARRQLLTDRISLARALGGAWLDQLADDRLAHSDKDPNP